MTQKIAIVTGAGTGVGRAAALALMKAGYAVALAGRRKDKLDEVAAEGAGAQGKSLVVPTDVADPASIKALFAAVKARFGRLDVLFNNAGIGAPAMPIDVLVARRDVCAAELTYRIEPGEPYFTDLRERWSAALRAAHASIPRVPYKNER